MNLIINGQDLNPILAGPPVISDQMEAVCRTLAFTVRKTESLDNLLGQQVDLWYAGSRWFTGVLRKCGKKHDNSISYLVYDPLIFLAKDVNDWYFKGGTATQNIKTLAESAGIRIKNLANTGAVLPPLYYQAAEGDKVAIDQLVRTFQANKKRFWFRYDPSQDAEGLDLFDRVVPAQLWAFQVGINLVSASYEESIEEAKTVVKLVNRDTGKIVTRVDAEKLAAWGKAVYFEEVDQDKAKNMEPMAAAYLASLSKVEVTQQIEGINPNQIMPQFFSGDFIYVEEKNTGILGGYHIRNITQTFPSNDLVQISADVEADASVPAIQFEDATKDPRTNQTGSGFQQAYNAETQAVMEKYGITQSATTANIPPDRNPDYYRYLYGRQSELTEKDVAEDMANSGGVAY